MFALGEATHKIKEKCKERALDVIKELYRLVDEGVLEVCHLNEERAQNAFGLAKQLMDMRGDDRDSVSPMDALIVASAASDPECTTFYTTDQNLMVNAGISDIINGWRQDNQYSEMCISDISNIIKLK